MPVRRHIRLTQVGFCPHGPSGWTPCRAEPPEDIRWRDPCASRCFSPGDAGVFGGMTSSAPIFGPGGPGPVQGNDSGSWNGMVPPLAGRTGDPVWMIGLCDDRRVRLPLATLTRV